MGTTQYHISEDGIPRKCSAKKGNCPLGDEDNHYSSFAVAQKAYEEYASNSLGAFPKTKRFPVGDEVLLEAQKKLDRAHDRTLAREVRQKIEVIAELLELEETSYARIEAMKLRSRAKELHGSSNAEESLLKIAELKILRERLTAEADSLPEKYRSRIKGLRKIGRAIDSTVAKLSPVDRSLAKKEERRGYSYVPVTEER